MILAVPDWGELQQLFLRRAEARLSGQPAVPFLLRKKDASLRRIPHLRAWARCGRTMLRTLLLRAPEGRSEVLIFTLAGRGAISGRDTYFGPLAAWLGAREVLTVYLAAGARVFLPGNTRLLPLEAFASPPQVAAAWIEGLGPTAEFTAGDPDHAALAARLAREEASCGEVFMNAFMRRALRSMLGRVRPRVLVYPFENRAWEKALLTAARDAGVERTVGYQHTSVTPRHLAFEIPDEAPVRYPLPDRLITVGSVTANWLAERAPALRSRIAIGASLRRAAQALPLPAAHGILVAISSSRSEALALMRLIHAAAPSITVPIVIRSHPTIPASDLFSRFAWPPHVRLSVGLTLEEDMAGATMILYSSSTVALEGMLQGRLPVFADIGDLPAGDPLIGDCPAKSGIESAQDLIAAVKSICAMRQEVLESRREAAMRYAEDYLRVPDKARIEAIVAEVLGEAPT